MSPSERQQSKVSGTIPPLPVAPPQLSPDVRLTRAQVAAALTMMGFPVARLTLATKAVRGGGPPYQSFGRVPLYRWGDALAWAEARLTPVRRSTSEHAAQHAL